MENFTQVALKNFENSIIEGQKEVPVDGSLALKEDTVENTVFETQAKASADNNVVYMDDNNGENERFLRAGEVAEKIGISTPTLRGYASEVSSHLSGKFNSKGERLYTNDDLLIIKKMYEYCRDNNVTKSFAKEMLFSNNASSNNGSGFTDEAMDKMMGKLDELSSVIRTLSDTLLLQNDIINNLRQELDEEKSARASFDKRLKQNTDAIKSYVGDVMLKTKKELTERIDSTAASDISDAPAFKEMQGQVKGISSVIDRIDNKMQTSVSADMLSKAISDNNEVLIKAISSMVKPDAFISSLKEENRRLKNELKEVKDSVPSSDNNEEVLLLKKENDGLRGELDRTLLAVRNMNDYIVKLESSGNDDSVNKENASLKKDLNDTLMAVRNMNEHIEKIESENASLKKENARLSSRDESDDADLFELNERLYDEIGVLKDENSVLKEKLADAMCRFDSLNAMVSSGNGSSKVKNKKGVKPSRKKGAVSSRTDNQTAKKSKTGILPVYDDEPTDVRNDEMENIKRSARKIPAVSALPDVDEYDDIDLDDEYHDDIDELPTELFGVDDVEDFSDYETVSPVKPSKANIVKKDVRSKKTCGESERKKKFLFF